MDNSSFGDELCQGELLSGMNDWLRDCPAAVTLEVRETDRTWLKPSSLQHNTTLNTIRILVSTTASDIAWFLLYHSSPGPDGVLHQHFGMSAEGITLQSLTKSLVGHPCLEILQILHYCFDTSLWELRDMPNLLDVMVTSNSRIDSVGGTDFRDLPNLEKVSLGIYGEYSHQMLDQLASLPALRTLELGG